MVRLCPSCHQTNPHLVYALHIIILMPRCLPCMLLSHSHYLVFISHHHLVCLTRYHLVCCLLYYYYYVKTTKMYPLFYHHSICTLSLLHIIIAVNPHYLPLLLYQGVCVCLLFSSCLSYLSNGNLISACCAFMFVICLIYTSIFLRGEYVPIPSLDYLSFTASVMQLKTNFMIYVKKKTLICNSWTLECKPDVYLKPYYSQGISAFSPSKKWNRSKAIMICIFFLPFIFFFLIALLPSLPLPQRVSCSIYLQ